ncbi:hypothetical protein KQI63_07500 [bacterium]|nr:hypothetical protein [bacterium]
MRTIWKYCLLFAGTVTLEALVLLLIGGYDRPPWGDEGHFIAAVHAFAANPLTITDYKEVTTPLTFYLYAGWGALFGMGVGSLRLLSMLLAGGSAVLTLHLFERFSYRSWLAIASTGFMVLFPYALGSGMFVYTDMLFQLLVLITTISLLEKKLVVWTVALTLALLTRQYALFLVLGAGLLGLRHMIAGDWKAGTVWWGTSLLAMIPLLGLMLVWGGISPPTGREIWGADSGHGWNPHAFTTLVTFSGLYLLPFIALSRKRLIPRGRQLFLLVPALLFFILFPVRASEVTQSQLGIETVGLLHKMLVRFLPEVFVWMVLVVGFVAGIVLLISVVRSLVQAWHHQNGNASLILPLLILAYLFLMPFSYQTWEKYLLTILPMMIAYLLSIHKQGIEQ